MVLGNLSVGILWILVEIAFLQKRIYVCFCHFSGVLNSWLEIFEFLFFLITQIAWIWSANLYESWLMVMHSWDKFFSFSPIAIFLADLFCMADLPLFLTFQWRFSSLGLSFKWRLLLDFLLQLSSFVFGVPCTHQNRILRSLGYGR